MNEADKSPNYKKLYDIACKYFKKTSHFSSGPGDETFFTLRVFESARELIKLLPQSAKKEKILCAALLHDIGKSKFKIKKIIRKNIPDENGWEEWHRHPKLSAKMAKPILKKLGHSQRFIDEVCHLIENHDKRDNYDGEKSIELQILQDADFIADTGMAGFIRPFLWSGKFKRPILEQMEYMKSNENSRLNLSKLNLEISKKIIKENAILEKSLKSQIIELMDSGLLQNKKI